MDIMLLILFVVIGVPMAAMVGYITVYGHDPTKVGGAQVVPTIALIFAFLLLFIVAQLTDAFSSWGIEL